MQWHLYNSLIASSRILVIKNGSHAISEAHDSQSICKHTQRRVMWCMLRWSASNVVWLRLYICSIMQPRSKYLCFPNVARHPWQCERPRQQVWFSVLGLSDHSMAQSLDEYQSVYKLPLYVHTTVREVSLTYGVQTRMHWFCTYSCTTVLNPSAKNLAGPSTEPSAKTFWEMYVLHEFTFMRNFYKNRPWNLRQKLILRGVLRKILHRIFREKLPQNLPWNPRVLFTSG